MRVAVKFVLSVVVMVADLLCSDKVVNDGRMEDGGWRMEDGGWRMISVGFLLSAIFVDFMTS